MLVFVEINDQTYKINADEPIDISIPMHFNGEQPNAYGVEKAVSKPCEAGDLVGDTRRGGSCNFEQITIIPHCNGTHTECIGHITNKRISIRDCLKAAFIPALLISVEAENAGESSDTYSIKLKENDKLITRKAIERAFGDLEDLKSKIESSRALVVRTLPNKASKLSKTYLEEIPPFFSLEAIKYISELKINHLLVDMPSIDRIFDDGKLLNHRVFWNVKEGSFETDETSLINNTITELIFVPERIADGFYLLNLQIASFASDAAPSRPILFEIFS